MPDIDVYLIRKISVAPYHKVVGRVFIDRSRSAYRER
jgi:hypothetical protein